MACYNPPMNRLLKPASMVALSALFSCVKHETGIGNSAPHADSGSVASHGAPLAAMPVDHFDFVAGGLDKYVKGVWHDANPENRWTVGKRLEMTLAYNEPGPSRLTVLTGAYLVTGKLTSQHVIVSLNGKPVGSFEVKEAGMKSYSLDLPAGAWASTNTLVFDLPDAGTPVSYKMGGDDRMLALAISRVDVKKI